MNKKFLLIFFAGFLILCHFVLATEKIDINTATLEQLDELAGIGPKYAQAIIDGRPYSLLDDLERVKGIGPKTLQKIKDQGLACVNCKQEEARPPEPEESGDVGLPAGSPTSGEAAYSYPAGIFINEILPSPKGPDETDEFIEIFNSNNFDVDLSGWVLQDKAGTVTNFEIDGKKIPAGGFLIFFRPETKIMLNNEGDGLSLLSPDKGGVDSVDFIKAPTGQSYNKTASGWAWSLTLTPGSNNIIALAPAQGGSASGGKNLINSKKSDTNNDTGAQDLLASLNPVKNDVSNGTNPWFLFYTTLVITIILAVIVLFIKLKIFNNHVRT